MDDTHLEAVAEAPEGLVAYRVSVEAQAHIALLGPDEPTDGTLAPRWGELSGRLRAAQKTDPFARPAVGDFVLARPPSGDGSWRIESVLPRRSQFVRQSARKRDAPQVVAANVDRVLVVTSPNEDFSPRRLERYLATIHASGAAAAVVLNKADLAEKTEPWLDRIREVALDAPVLATSAVDGAGLGALESLLEPGSTVAMVGSSGVGKSSLANLLIGAERQRVQEARAGDDKGRHTTTHRELFVLPAGPNGEARGLLVDTPGMRALALWMDADTLLDAFADIAELAEECRFRDCKHDSEPGCAVRAALDAGELSPGRLQSYARLREEAQPNRRHR